MAPRKRQMRRRQVPRTMGCYYCKQNIVPDYKNLDTVQRFVSERGKILGVRDTGVCQKHQRALSQAVKRARYMALLPFVVRPS